MEKYQHQKFLVPIDGSKITPHLVDRAIELAKQNNATIDLLNVMQIDQLTDGFASTMEIDEDGTYTLVKTIEERLDDLKQRAIKSGVKDVHIHIRFGSPKEVIAREFPADHHTDLTIIGATGLSRVERVLVGSTTAYVVRYSPCDVMVIH
ncbi:universal stress protein [uncultured Limosilactobacillus sp.]|uniref:universal stress protein n=1 Tax=uncultured Limosilactobacillus sp. TaxID=2837629 RepID=UPI0025E8C952|nr:universal stress protein [uncultured Limosilactobacillus sp.]